MARQKLHLPRRFPIGTTFSLEGEPVAGGGMRVVASYVVFPNGKRIDLPFDGKRIYVCKTNPVQSRKTSTRRRADERQPAAVAAHH